MNSCDIAVTTTAVAAAHDTIFDYVRISDFHFDKFND